MLAYQNDAYGVGSLANLFYCVKNRTLAFLKVLGLLPLNSRGMTPISTLETSIPQAQIVSEAPKVTLSEKARINRLLE